MAHPPHDDERTPPPWSRAPFRAAVRGLLAPVERFLAIQTASGILLLLAAALALAWANSPWRESYTALWETPIGLRFGALAFERSLGWWINDGLMVVFFFVVGLEIRREIHAGELSDLRRAALPLAAALGGMVMPALIYAGFNRGLPTLDGWGIPMATDIAFAVGVLTLLGKRVPPALRILLLALAVIDDLGAILVIALFYSSGIQLVGMLVMASGVLGVLGMQWVGVRSPWAYVLPTLAVWGGAYAGGIHPTLAGVIVGLLTPVRERVPPAWTKPPAPMVLALASVSEPAAMVKTSVLVTVREAAACAPVFTITAWLLPMQTLSEAVGTVVVSHVPGVCQVPLAAELTVHPPPPVPKCNSNVVAEVAEKNGTGDPLTSTNEAKLPVREAAVISGNTWPFAGV